MKFDEKMCFPVDGEWNIHVTTASVDRLPSLGGGETAGEVSVVVYGSKSTQGPIPLVLDNTDSPVTLLAPGKTDVYHVSWLPGSLLCVLKYKSKQLDTVKHRSILVKYRFHEIAMLLLHIYDIFV